MFLTDAARYMSLTGKTLKELYPLLVHVNCVAHLLHSCAMRVRAHCKNIDEVITTIKAATFKSKDRKKDFHDAGLPSPPDPVITRWASWPYITVKTFQLFVPWSRTAERFSLLYKENCSIIGQV